MSRHGVLPQALYCSAPASALSTLSPMVLSIVLFFFTSAAGTLTCFSVCFPEILLMMIFEIIENGVDLYTYYDV